MPVKRSISLWDWLTFAGLMLLVFTAMALWYRWLRPDPDFLDFSTGMMELVTIASFLGLQTEGGKKLVLRLDNFLGLGQWLSSPPRACLLVWGLLGLVAFLLYVVTPQAAQLYRQRGAESFEQGAYSLAIRNFKQALSLDPENARTHYNLANAYEQLYDYDGAMVEYQEALEQDDSFWPAYNNLGRLHLIARSDPDAALATLLSGERRAGDPLNKAILRKNIAWAYLEKGFSKAAHAELESAIGDLKTLRAEGGGVETYLAEASRLLAQVYQAQHDSAAAQSAWQDSLGYALAVSESSDCRAEGQRLPPDCLSAIGWASEAREMLHNAP